MRGPKAVTPPLGTLEATVKRKRSQHLASARASRAWWRLKTRVSRPVRLVARREMAMRRSRGLSQRAAVGLGAARRKKMVDQATVMEPKIRKGNWVAG